MTNHSIKAQLHTLRQYLETNRSATTTEIRHDLDILQPAARIFELRHEQNLNIKRTWKVTENPGGTDHKVALYTLHEGFYKEVA
ncbi:MAG: hypothetical protein ACI9SP_003123 [Arenicella sp.]|jgi:hypothetical protein